MPTKVFDSSTLAYDYGAKILIDAINSNHSLKIGLAAGNTPTPLYNRLAKAYTDKKIQTAKLSTFNLDEYVGVPPSSENSFSLYTRTAFNNRLKIPDTQTHTINGAASNPIEEASRYLGLIQKNGPIDLQILGLGVNGHVGFNEPGCTADSKTRVVNLSTSTVSRLNPASFGGVAPKQGITIGISEILSAKKIILLAVGAEKTEAVKNCFTGTVSPQWPASFLQKHPGLIIILDKEAAKGLFQA